MSLVAYEYSSGDDSGDEENEETPSTSTAPEKTNGLRHGLVNTEPTAEQSSGGTDSTKPFIQLPTPKKINDLGVKEEDDEFLRKKAVPDASLLPPKPIVRNGKVQITIPSIRDFDDDGKDADGEKKKANPIVGASLPKKTNLLSLLPKPRAEVLASQLSTSTSSSKSSESTSFSKRLVPDSVANRPRSVPASAVKPADRTKVSTSVKASLPGTSSAAHVEASDEEDDDDDVDFFSFNKVDTLPTVSANEISAMVAKKAAKISETVRKYTEVPDEQTAAAPSQENAEAATNARQNSSSEDLASETALAALIGGNRAKRARVEQVDLIEISSADIVPTKEDFLRRQLQDETGYVPTGNLVGDWTCTSKRKSHITQLASKAQANAQELEAMWAANRQSRRQTQSKYGF